MKKYGVVLALVVVSVAVWVASASAISSPQAFSLLAVNSQNLPAMNGFEFQRPPQPGDQINIGDTLYKWAGTKRGAKVGRDRGIITFMSVGQNGGTGSLNAQFYLPGGTVVVQGILHFPANGPAKFTLPVVGGTGKYDNVRGYINFHDLGDGNQNKASVDLHLLP
jgi:hypothetical protein